jgi:hypothetical protein
MNGYTALINDIPILVKKDSNGAVKEYLTAGELIKVMSKDNNKGRSWRYVERLKNGTRGYINWTAHEADFYKWRRVKLLEWTSWRGLTSKKKQLPKETIGYFVEVNNPLDLYVRFWTENELEGTIKAQTKYKETMSEGAEFAVELVVLFIAIIILLAMIGLGVPWMVIRIFLIIFTILGLIIRCLKK